MQNGSSEGVAGFFGWWLGQLADLLPPGLRGAGLASPDAVVIEPARPLADGAEMTVWRRRKGEETLLGRFAAGAAPLADLPHSSRLPAIVRLTPADILEKRLSLPVAAQAELAQVLAFEMDRETPFAADEVYWTSRVEGYDRQRGTIQVRLAVLPKSRLAALRDGLAQGGIEPQWVEVAEPAGDALYLPLGEAHDQPQQRSRMLLRPAAVCCAVLALAAVATPFVRQALVLQALDREIAATRPVASRAETLRGEIDSLSRSADLIKGELDKAGRPLEVLAALTRLVPDDTYLTEAELRQRKLTLTGRSGGAARLISLLAADGRFRNPSFAAPVTRVEVLHAEVFTIVADVEGAP